MSCQEGSNHWGDSHHRIQESIDEHFLCEHPDSRVGPGDDADDKADPRHRSEGLDELPEEPRKVQPDIGHIMNKKNGHSVLVVLHDEREAQKHQGQKMVEEKSPEGFLVSVVDFLDGAFEVVSESHHVEDPDRTRSFVGPNPDGVSQVEVTSVGPGAVLRPHDQPHQYSEREYVVIAAVQEVSVPPEPVRV